MYRTIIHANIALVRYKVPVSDRKSLSNEPNLVCHPLATPTLLYQVPGSPYATARYPCSRNTSSLLLLYSCVYLVLRSI